MKIVGLVDNKAQAQELENIAKLFVVGNRSRVLAHRIRE